MAEGDLGVVEHALSGGPMKSVSSGMGVDQLESV
jgi:hypothetical protein